MNKDWMNDEALSHIERRKLDFLHTLVIESASLKQTELLPFFLSLAKRGQSENIQFSKDEIRLISDVIKKNSSDADRAKIDKILNIAR
ncbi:MAG: hypothetical protein NC254_06455 [bacterium]|nr:hypothetical protein [bacterium]